MKKSAAPSQLIKRDGRASFFSPPYKVPVRKIDVPSSHTIKNELTTQSSSKPVTTPVFVKTSSDLVNIINSVKPCDSKQKKQNEIQPNTFFNNQENNELKLKSNLTGHVQDNSDTSRYFSVVWCKLSKKKHKNWEGDAILIVKGRSVVLKDMEGKEIGRGSGYKLKDLESLDEGNTLPVGAKEIEIQNRIESKHYISGKCFQNSASGIEDAETKPIPDRTKPKPFRLPLRDCSNSRVQGKPSSVALHNIDDVNAILLPKPPAQHQWAFNSEYSSIIDVVVDPHLGSQLRPHQQAGVVFLYECVMGFRRKEYKGAILADEMGLGKTLQCITLIWTLLKQGPYGGIPILKKVLIVTPSSLVSNWNKEFEKWLGKERIQTYVVDQNNKVSDFKKQRISSILIISYEMLIRCVDQIQQMEFDLLLCDEGHRLKNGQIKTSTLLNSLNIKRRIIITGTPIQNDLQELYALIEFVNPGILGSSLMFRKVYEEPILKSQQPFASAEDKEIGLSRAGELNRLTSQFTLRRTQEIINKYLPPKTEFVVFCQPSKSQSDIYETTVSSKGLQRCLVKGELGDHLAAICILRKLCNHPGLLMKREDGEHQSEIQSEISSLIPKDVSRESYLEEDSGKLAVVSCLLWSLAESKREKIVIVSNFTTTLDMLQHLCERYKYSFLRLDGSTPSSKRQNLVDRFNSSYGKEFVFLLSSKAGGVGLNLIGASRILLFDIDWNPATDLQAMARVWRDGQKKRVFIYRLLLAGSIEEKMYQRQVCKQGISGSVVDARSNAKAHFSIEELKDLFRFYPGVSCVTHDLLNCSCDQMGGGGTCSQPLPLEERDCQLGEMASKCKASAATMDQLHSWQHYSLPQGVELLDDYHIESGSDFISFVFKSQMTQENAISLTTDFSSPN